MHDLNTQNSIKVMVVMATYPPILLFIFDCKEYFYTGVANYISMWVEKIFTVPSILFQFAKKWGKWPLTTLGLLHMLLLKLTASLIYQNVLIRKT